MELQNTKTSTTFLKIGKHLEKEKVNLSDLTSKFFFFRIESIFCKPFPKNTNPYSQYLPSSFIISILTTYPHSLLDKQSVRFNHASFLEKYEHYISKFTCYYILCILCHESYPSDFVMILPYMTESS